MVPHHTDSNAKRPATCGPFAFLEPSLTAQNLPEHLLREALDLVKKHPSRLAAAKNATRLDGKKGLAPRSFAHRLEVAERVLGEKAQDATKGMGGASKIDPALLREAVDLMNEHGSTAVCLRYATRADGKKGISPSQFRLRLQAAREELNLTPETGVGDELERLREENRRLRADAATTKRDELTRESIRQHIIGLTAVKPEPPKWLKGAKRPHAGLLGVPTLFCSDWHWGEVVRPTELGGVNDFNLEIAHKRVHRMVDTAIDLLRNHLVGARYDGIVLILGGDMVSGNIHDELTITNELPIMPVIVDLYGILISVITRLADEFGHVFLPCVAGNHGRNTRKPVSKERWGTSFDWLLYSLLAKHFAGDKRVTFDIPEGPDCEFRVYQHRYLLTHGDQFRGGDGLIGPLGPLCVAPDTLILKPDLSYVRADSLKPGDEIIGFDEGAESSAEGGDRRKFKTSVVEDAFPLSLDCYEIETDDGQKTIASVDHPWLCRSGMRQVFIKSRDLRIGTRIMSFGKPWEHDTNSWEAGYLAGVLDGEGTLEPSGRLKFTQQENPCMRRTLGILDKYGIPYRLNENGSEKRGFEACYGVALFNGCDGIKDKLRNKTWRLLGTVRPERIITEQFRASYEGVSTQVAGEARVIGIRHIGEHPVTAFSTSTKTFIGNGMLMHNTRGRHKKASRDAAMNTHWDTMLCGHFHTLMQLPHLVVNGSLKGYDEYAYQGNFSFEQPAQAMWITHPTRGITWQAAIKLNDAVDQQESPWVSVPRAA